MSEMENTADHLVVIGRGRLIADCPMTEFTGTARATVVRTPDAGKLVAAVTAAGGALDQGDGHFTVRGLGPERVGELALAHGIPLYHLAPARVSLQEAFMELTADSVEFEAKG